MMNDFYSYKTKILAGKKLNISPKLKKAALITWLLLF